MRSRRIIPGAVAPHSRRGFFTLCLGGTAVLFVRPKEAQAGLPFLPATELTQVLNNIQLVLTYIRQAAQLLSQVNQERMMIQNLVHNGIHGLAGMENFLNTASGIVQGGLAIAYSTANMDLAFQKQFPGYANFDSAHPWAQNYLNWANTNRATIAGTLRMVNLSAQDLGSSQQMMSVLRAHAAGATGAQQILETLGEFASAQVNELQGLRSLMLADQQSKASFMAMQQQQMDTSAAAQAKFWGNGGAASTDNRVYDPVTGVH